MRSSFFIIIFMVPILLFGFGPSQKGHEKLKEEVESLCLEKGPLRTENALLETETKSLYASKLYEKAKAAVNTLVESCPGAKDAMASGELLVKNDRAAEKQKAEIKGKKKQKARAIKRVTEKKQEKTENKKAEAEKKGEPEGKAGVEKEDISENKTEKKVSLERKIEIAQAAKHMKTRRDDQDGTTWYHDKNSPLFMDTGSFQIYFGLKGGSKPLLRLRVQYQGEDWLFIRSFTIIADKNEFKEPAANFNRGKAQTRAWEWYDGSLTRNDIEMIKAIIYSSRAVVILKGSVDEKARVITSAEKESMKNVLDAYLAVGGEL